MGSRLGVGLSAGPAARRPSATSPMNRILFLCLDDAKRLLLLPTMALAEGVGGPSRSLLNSACCSSITISTAG